MDDVKVFAVTGIRAANHKHAAALNRKLRSAQSMGRCILLDWTGVALIHPDFIRLVTRDLRSDKVHLAGLWSNWQSAVPVDFELPPPPPGRPQINSTLLQPET